MYALAHENVLREEGYTHVWMRTEKAGCRYTSHIHPVDTARIVLRGGMRVEVGREEYLLRRGDRLNLKKGMQHSVTIGPDGCTFLVGTWC